MKSLIHEARDGVILFEIPDHIYRWATRHVAEGEAVDIVGLVSGLPDGYRKQVRVEHNVTLEA